MRRTLPVGLLFALLVPALAHAAPATNDEVVAAAKASPHFKRQLKRTQLDRSGLAKIKLGNGIEMSFLKYVKESALDKHPAIAPLFDAKLRPDPLKSAPSYTETIYELTDRFVVERRLTIAFDPLEGCKRPDLPAAVRQLCFTKNPKNKGSKAVTKDLAEIRGKLAKAEGTTIVHGKVTAAEAAKMTDEALLELLLNGDQRTITHVSVVPRVGGKAGIKGLVDFADALMPADAAQSNLTDDSKGPVKPPHAGTDIFATAHTFATKYFLTGFTYGREFDDAWEYTIADSTWLTDRYYIRFAYHLGLGFGVRAPFSVDVKSTGSGNARDVELKVAPVDVDQNGNPAYPAVGLPENKTFGGKEFVLEFKASCNLYVSIPGPNFDKSCPSIDKDKSRDIDPVIGSESSKIADWWLTGSETGLKLDYAIASASLDLGVGADVTNGKVGMRFAPLASSSLTGLSAGSHFFTSRSPVSFGVSRSAGAAGAGFRVDQPRYGFDLRFTPKLRGVIEVDVAIYEHSWTLGPWSLDFLALSTSFMLSRHDGTVDKHDFGVFVDDGLVLDPNAGTTPTPPPKKGPKGPAAPTAPSEVVK